MKNILIISGHTNLAASVANKTILETLNERLPEAEIVKLDELYPDFKIDVEAEQQKLLRADIIVLQFPLFWYSAPSILERWMEETFRHGFSHGSTGDKLKDKKLILSFTTGAPETLYSREGAMGYATDSNGILRQCLYLRHKLRQSYDTGTYRAAKGSIGGTR